MATRTLTSTPVANNVVRNIHAGMVAQGFDVNSGATVFGTIGDAVLLARIPHAVALMDYNIRIRTPSTSILGRMVLTQGTTDTTLPAAATAAGPSTTLTAVAGGQRFRGAFDPFLVSLSDDAAVQYGVLKFQVTAGTESTTFCLAGYVSYSRDLF